MLYHQILNQFRKLGRVKVVTLLQSRPKQLSAYIIYDSFLFKRQLHSKVAFYDMGADS
jgi:hypothetical protein